MMRSLAAYMPADFNTFDTNATSSLYQDGRIALMNMWGSRAGSFLDPAQSQPEVAENTVFASAPDRKSVV